MQIGIGSVRAMSDDASERTASMVESLSKPQTEHGRPYNMPSYMTSPSQIALPGLTVTQYYPSRRSPETETGRIVLLSHPTTALWILEGAQRVSSSLCAHRIAEHGHDSPAVVRLR